MQIKCVQKFFCACRKIRKLTSQIKGKGKRKRDAVNGGNKGYLDTVDQRRDRARHLFVAGRIEFTQSHDKTDERTENTEACQNIGDQLKEAAVRMLLDRFFVDEAADIAGNVRISVQHTAVLAVAVIQKVVLEQRISAVCQGVEIAACIFQSFRRSLQTVAGLYQTAQPDRAGGADHDEHDA